MRAVLTALLTTAALLAAAAAPGAAHAQERVPVLFVHGYGGSAGNWDDLAADLVADGWPEADLHAIDYDSTASNTETAEVIAAEVDAVLAESGADRVDIVAHSMGGLSSRWYLKFLGGHERVDDWVSLAGPNQGSTVRLPCVAVQPSCQEVVAGSEFLARLNSGDPTPGAVGYTTFRSLCDLIVRPSTNVMLTGADNRYAGCVGHTAFLTDPGVSAQVRAVLA
ncbi:triacylglycerol lipase [Streptomonospora sp. S1-112]|uniref:Triacylglycerol lipase n=1 Tax=Streptomonospora mangrovi TaxID=2883123 RepID=A0A9X3NIN6_9ACTN|nr:triacylglycerol lipase [Streptomonospora mangrovi]MDA0563903.1 triacylglycerol lipase [Streptomonospora mangrovi]